MSEELRPCPFCGEQVFPPLASSLDDGYTRCGLCGAKMQHRRWQTRPIEDALNARIAELEAERRWIPVSERLPEDLQPIVIITKGGMTGIVRYLELYGREGFGSWSEDVTHWMPLPELPEERER